MHFTNFSSEVSNLNLVNRSHPDVNKLQSSLKFGANNLGYVENKKRQKISRFRATYHQASY